MFDATLVSLAITSRALVASVSGAGGSRDWRVGGIAQEAKCITREPCRYLNENAAQLSQITPRSKMNGASEASSRRAGGPSRSELEAAELTRLIINLFNLLLCAWRMRKIRVLRTD